MLIAEMRKSEKPVEQKSLEKRLTFDFLKDAVMEQVIELWNTDENGHSLILEGLENVLSVQGVQIGYPGAYGQGNDEVHHQRHDVVQGQHR